MSEEVVVRDQFEIPAVTSNDSQSSLGNDSKIEPEKLMVCDEIDSTLNIAGVSEKDFKVSEQADIWEAKDTTGYKTPNQFKESDEAAPEEISFVEGEEELSSGSSFTSCCSYRYMRKSILCREIRDASTLSLDSGIDIASPIDLLLNRDLDKDQDQLQGTPLYPGIEKNSSSTRIVMEKRELTVTSEDSEGDCELSLDEVYQRFSAWFNHNEIDTAFSSFMQADEDMDGYICLGELKRFLEKLAMPQTHLAAKNVMTHVVGKHVERLNFCHALLIYGTVLNRLELRKWHLLDRERHRLARSKAVDVSKVGVSGAKEFFEAKIALQTDHLPINSDQPVARVPVHSLNKENTGSRRVNFKSAAALFKKLESEQ
ncbi:EF-hand domain-containing protein D2 homolog [Drosophila teissieri]|uniref:EF-hand domain-containing protein D2 homolog n=1 Tax=Drosophila teissieri TaxID=7243 RepID=UPI001CBA0EC1|nr:EF-hand domain-containing protein D2 homolog [Drosophila teissieri]